MKPAFHNAPYKAHVRWGDELGQSAMSCEPHVPRPHACFAERLRTATRALHIEAERTGVVSQILRGKASRMNYALFIRNLLPVYERIEGSAPSVAHADVLFAEALRRASAIRADLGVLLGPDWERGLPLLASARSYAARVTASAEGSGERLIAHSYVRYLGDLSGGQILKRLLMRSMGLPEAALAFYDFPGIPDPDEFKAAYHAALEAVTRDSAAADAVIEEAAAAFRHNIAVSVEVAHRTAQQGSRNLANSQ